MPVSPSLSPGSSTRADAHVEARHTESPRAPTSAHTPPRRAEGSRSPSTSVVLDLPRPPKRKRSDSPGSAELESPTARRRRPLAPLNTNTGSTATHAAIAAGEHPLSQPSPRAAEAAPATEAETPAADPMAQLNSSVLQTIRDDYYKGEDQLKSSSKRTPGKHKPGQIDDLTRAGRAAEEIAELRDALEISDYDDELEATRNSLAHNCHELSFLARHELRERGVDAVIVKTEAKHAFVAYRGSGPLEGELPADMRLWPDDAYVCDGWANIACKARDYPQRFADKMKQWADRGKEVYFAATESWVPANHPGWMKLMLEGTKGKW
jgi:hypothetical protein